jgi:hypothetical protein
MIRKLLLLIIFIIFPVLTFGQIWTNPITGNNINSNNTYTSGDVKDTNITVSGISRGTGVQSAVANNSYSAVDWTNNTNSANVTSDYFQFTITPNSGYKIDLTSFEYTGATNNSGPTRFVLRSSVDSYTSNIDGEKTIGDTFSLTGSSYQNISSAITFRIYGYKSSNGTGSTFRINDFKFNGTVCTSPITTGASICQGGAGSLTSTTNGVTTNTFTGSWNAATDPTARIPSGGVDNSAICGFENGSVRNYTATTFTVGTTGVYTFKMTNDSYDGMAYIYSGNFTPGTCSGGGSWVVGDDDNGNNNASEPRMTPTLTAGVLYTLISTTYGNSDTIDDNYTWTVTSPPAAGQITLAPVSWYTAATGGTPIGAGSPFNPVGVSGSGLANTNTVGTTTYYASLGGSCTRTPTTFVINGETPTTTLGTYTFCIDNSMIQTTANAKAGQYALVNIVKGYKYKFSVGNVFAGNNEKLNILDATTDLEVSPTGNNTSTSGATISDWEAPFSGQIKVLLSTGNCSNTGLQGTGGITLTLNSIGDSLESQNEIGTDNWVGHIYNSVGNSPEPFAIGNYAGYYNIPTETINENFGGDANCIDVYSNGVKRASMYTEQFAVKYKMKTTKSGCYIITVTGDDGIRLSLNGTKVFDRWLDQGSTSYYNVLVNLKANDVLTLDYYENAQGNVLGFSMTPFNPASNTITAPAAVTFCSNGDPAVIEGSLQYNSNDPNLQNPQLNFQWQLATDTGNFADIPGATGRTYDPPAIVNNTAANIVRRFKRLITLNTANVPDINNVRTSCLYTESNIVTITTTPTPVISAMTASACTGVAFNVTPTGGTIPAGTTYSWGAPTVTGGAGALIGGAASTGLPTSIAGTLTNTTSTAQTATYTVTPTASGCAGTTFTVIVTVNPLPIILTQPQALILCEGQNGAFTISTSATSPTYQWQYSTSVSGPWTATNTAPITGISGHNTATLSIANVATIYSGNFVRCIVTSGTCNTISNPVLLTVNPTPTAPTVGTPTNLTCANQGSVILTNLPAGNWTLNQTGFASRTINNSGNTYPVTGLAAGTYRFTVSNGTCTSAVSTDAIIIDQSSTTWDGTGWSNGLPNAAKSVIITGAYNVTADLNACSLTISSGVSITVPSSRTLNIENGVTVAPTASLIFENNSSLVQKNDSGINSGSITYKRIAPQIRQADFVYWSTPVSPQQLLKVSPLTSGDKYFGYNGTGWVATNPKTNMTVGKGYIIRGPNNFSTTAKADYPASFIGVPNNGIITGETVTAGNVYLIGNPYPSGLSADKFLGNNLFLDGTLYFWTHNTPVVLVGAYRYSSTDYASYNLTGGVGTAALSGSIPGNNKDKPSGFIGAGQSFFSTATTNGTVAFNNDMRLGADKNSQFFKNAGAIQKSRVWLNMSNAEGAFKQTLVGYVEGATNEYENRYDGVTFDANPYIDFYSVANGNNYVIQARSFPFTDTDQVPLGYRTTIAGDFTISIDDIDGDLTNKNIYLEDKKTSTINDLRAGNYTFTTAVGTFADRFVLRYASKTLGTGDFENVENGLLVSVKDKTIKVTSSIENIKEVTIFDVSGKLLYNKKKVGSTELQIQNLPSANQVLLVKVTLDNNFTATKKIIFN